VTSIATARHLALATWQLRRRALFLPWSISWLCANNSVTRPRFYRWLNGRPTIENTLKSKNYVVLLFDSV